MKLFKRVGTKFQEVARQSYSDEHFESHLEDLIEKNPNLLGDLMIIGRQVKTDRAERIDLLALDREGNVVIIELKRGPAHREIVSQINSYLTTARKWRYDDLERLAGGGLISAERALVKKFQQHFTGVKIPEAFNRKQHGIIVAETIDEATIEDLGGLRSPIVAFEFSHFPGSTGEEYLLLGTKSDSPIDGSSEPGRVIPPTRKQKVKLRDYDAFLMDVADHVKKMLPTNLAGIKTTTGHWEREQNRRFHWGGMDIHVGVDIEREDAGDTASVYFCNWKRDTRVVELLAKNEEALKKALALRKEDLNWKDLQCQIDQSLGKITLDSSASLVALASERTINFLQALKPILGELL